MDYQMAPMEVTLNDLGSHSVVADLFKCSSLAIYVALLYGHVSVRVWGQAVSSVWATIINT